MKQLNTDKYNEYICFGWWCFFILRLYRHDFCFDDDELDISGVVYVTWNLSILLRHTTTSILFGFKRYKVEIVGGTEITDGASYPRVFAR